MNLYLAAFIALLCAVAGVALGRGFSRLRSPYWTIGYVFPLVLVFAYALAFRIPAIMFTPPFSWMMLGIKKFVMFGFVATMVLTTPLSRIPHARNRVMIMILMAVVVFYMGVWPFLAAIVDRPQLSRLKTNIDTNGVCLQTTDYTCGPAAAVTALRKLGLSADEGQIGILSCTSNQEGTPVDMLADGLKKEYRKDGLEVNCRVFKSVSELKDAGLTLAVIKYRFLEDHWVTVLGLTDSEVILGDPLAGVTRLSYEDFSSRWRFIGIVLQRSSGQASKP
jgi:predicted double-glycine peptidase